MHSIMVVPRRGRHTEHRSLWTKPPLWTTRAHTRWLHRKCRCPMVIAARGRTANVTSRSAV